MSTKKSEDETYLTPEAFHERRQAGTERTRVTIPLYKAAAAVAVVILLVISFLGGVSYQKHHASTAAVGTAATGSTSQSGTGNGFARGGGMRGGFGSVTAVSATSITISNMRTGTDQTYSITSATTITDNGSTVTASDIQTGDRVVIRPTTSGGTIASSIDVNPSFGGAAGGGQGGATPDSSSTQNN